MNSDELNLMDVTIFLWKNKRNIVATTSLITFGGFIFAIISPSIYQAQAIIAPKEQPNYNPSSILSSFGQVGNIVSSQIGLGGINLEGMEITLKSYELAENVVKKHNLKPRLFQKIWDPETEQLLVTDSASIPSLREAIELYLQSFLSVSSNRKTNTLTISVNSYDPNLSAEIVTHHLDEYNKFTINNFHEELRSNQNYLEKQLENTTDPLLKEKILSILAGEIEKTMFYTSQTFKVLSKPIVPSKRIKPNRRNIVIVWFFIGIVFSILLVGFLHFLKVFKLRIHT